MQDKGAPPRLHEVVAEASKHTGAQNASNCPSKPDTVDEHKINKE